MSYNLIQQGDYLALAIYHLELYIKSSVESGLAIPAESDNIYVDLKQLYKEHFNKEWKIEE